MSEITEDNVKVIVLSIMNDKVVYRENCKGRHKIVEKLEKKVDSMDTKLWLILVVLLGNLVGMISWLLRN